MFEYTAFEPNAATDLALQALCDVNLALGDLEDEYDAPERPTVKLRDHCETESNDDNADGFVGDIPANDAAIHDDRAIIVVESDESTNPPAAPEGSVHRVEYQTLFAQLRHG